MATALDIPDAITFEAGMQLTQTLLGHMEAGDWSETDVHATIAQLVRTMNGARGFFVTYLTDDRPLSDHPSDAVIQALQSAPDIVASLLVKNLAMSTAMVLTHQRQHNLELAQNSDRVARRTATLIQRLQSPAVQTEAQHLQDSLKTDAGEYATFLKRWGYDPEQKQAIQTVLNQTVTP